MLTNTLYRVPRRHGLHVLQTREDGGARELSSWRLVLGAGERGRFEQAGEETVFVLQQGAADVRAGDARWRISRAAVFQERATAIYLPPGMPLDVHATAPLEAILIATPADAGGRAALVTPADVQPTPRGRGSYAREVHNIFVDDPHARRLIVGETFNPPGNWSSYPPHKHDGVDGEPVLEEVYHFRIDPPQGFGHQLLYTAAGESCTHQVRDGDTVLLPYGYHPVSAAPGYRLYYLWALSGQQRRLAVYEDPQHRWIHDVEHQTNPTARLA
jgi:5-deoxy-glucuronate isomerase